MFLFKRKVCYPLNCFAARDLTLFSYFYSPSTLLSSSSANPHVESPLFVDYFIKTVGLSLEMAIKSSKSLARHKSLSNPDAVVRFFKESGFSDSHIKRIVSKRPKILIKKVDATLKPKLTALKEIGFSESEIHDIVSRNPYFLNCGDIPFKLKFWMSFLGSKWRLFNFIIRGRYILGSNVDTNVIPKISFLRSMGYSDNVIVTMITQYPNFLSKTLDSITIVSKRAEEMGFSFGTSASGSALITLSRITAETLNSKLKLLRSFGWSEAEVTSAIGSTPRMLATSEKKMRVVIDFLVNQEGCDPSCIIKNPRVLMYSVERRMIPRNYVLQLLGKKVLLKNNLGLLSVILLSELQFVKKYIIPYKEEIPELHQIYITLCAGKSTLV